MLAYAKYLTAESASTGDKNPITSTKLKEIDINEKNVANAWNDDPTALQKLDV